MRLVRLAKIVATLGPASAKPETVRAMIRAGMDVARLNAAHGTVAERAAAVRTVREAAEAEGKAMAILLDLAGAKIRTGAGSVTLLEGDVVDLRAGRGRSGGGLIYVDYEDLAGDVRPGERVLLADGEAELEVLEGSAGGLRCRVLAGGRVGTRKGVAFPDSELRLEVPTVADREAVEWGSREGVDYLGLSFTGAASHVAALKQQVRELGGAAMVIAKIERRVAVERLEEILEVADGVMVARGDLGVELPLETVPLEQRRIIQAASRRLRPVITATQMLESMVEAPRPTRAEASDVANAVWDGSDAVMLSGETAVGRHPVEAVAMMDRLIRAAESEEEANAGPPPVLETDNHSFVIAAAARRMTEYDRKIAAIVSFSTSGATAFLLSKVRPRVPVFALTPFESTMRRLALARGVVPLACPLPDSAEEMHATLDRVLVAGERLAGGSEVVVVGSIPLEAKGATNFLNLYTLGSVGGGSASR